MYIRTCNHNESVINKIKSKSNQNIGEIDPWSRSDQTFFSPFFFFCVKLGHFTINNFFLYVTKMQAYQQKTEKFFVCEEKSLVGSTPGVENFFVSIVHSIYFIKLCGKE